MTYNNMLPLPVFTRFGQTEQKDTALLLELHHFITNKAKSDENMAILGELLPYFLNMSGNTKDVSKDTAMRLFGLCYEHRQMDLFNKAVVYFQLPSNTDADCPKPIEMTNFAPAIETNVETWLSNTTTTEDTVPQLPRVNGPSAFKRRRRRQNHDSDFVIKDFSEIFNVSSIDIPKDIKNPFGDQDKVSPINVEARPVTPTPAVLNEESDTSSYLPSIGEMPRTNWFSEFETNQDQNDDARTVKEDDYTVLPNLSDGSYMSGVQ